MEAHIHEWTNLLVRWIHFIVGTAWIGASFYFNWLENNLDRKGQQDSGIAGDLWAVHGGGFYYLKKFSTGPEAVPARLHWFKWEAYTTWLSGFALLVVVYYYNAKLFLIDAQKSALTPWMAIAVGVGSLVLSWIIYDLLCKSKLKQRPALLSIIVFLYFTMLAWLLSALFTGRAAYIHVGAAIGTVMVANVFFVIIPAQKEMVNALRESRTPDPNFGINGLLRSRHNNYLTLPVLFIMISSHFPSTYGHRWNWIILFLLSALSVIVRHYFNIRHLHKSAIWLLPLAFAAFVAVIWFSAPKTAVGIAPDSSANVNSALPTPTIDDIMPLVQSRCVSCHATMPTQPGFNAAPAGLVLETAQQVSANAAQIYQTTVVTKIMPLANLTAITDEERNQLAAWYRGRSASAN